MKLLKLDLPTVDSLKTVIYNDGFYYVVSEKKHSILKSSDLENWNEIKIDTQTANDTFIDITFGNGKYIICGRNRNKTYFYVSTDGINFKKQFILEYNLLWEKIVYVNNRFIAIAAVVWGDVKGSIIMTSYDGNTWLYNEFSTGGFSGSDIIYVNGKYYIVGSNGGIAYSKDLKNWVKITSGIKSNLTSIIYARNKFVVVGYDGVILTSDDGINFSRQKTETNSVFSKIQYGNGLFCACGYNGILKVSIDGIDWDTIDTNTKSLLYGLVYVNNKYLFTGSNGYAGFLDVSRDLITSDEDCLFIYNNDLQLLGIIDSFISLRWRRKFFEAGEFELVVVPDSKTIKLLMKKDNIIIRNNYTEGAIIDSYYLEDDGDNIELHVTGKFLSYILHRRILKKTINFKGLVTDGMRQLLLSMSPFPNLEFESVSVPSDIISFQCSYKNIYDYFVKLAKFSNIGFRIVPNVENKVYILETYLGKDRSSYDLKDDYYTFSDDNYNVEHSKYTYSSDTEYNYALIGGTGEGDNRVLVEVNKTGSSGFDLREIFVDAKNQSNKDLSTSDYRNLLIDAGNEKLTDETKNFEITAYSDDYKTKWDLGDVVVVDKYEWMIHEKQRIVEIEEIIEDGKRSVYPTFGTPLKTIFEEE